MQQRHLSFTDLLTVAAQCNVNAKCLLHCMVWGKTRKNLQIPRTFPFASIISFLFWGGCGGGRRVRLCRSHYVVFAGLELTETCLPLPQMSAGITGMYHHALMFLSQGLIGSA